MKHDGNVININKTNTINYYNEINITNEVSFIDFQKLLYSFVQSTM